MRLARARMHDTNHVVLVRLEGDDAVVLAEESAHVAADVLREAVHSGIDLAGRGATRVAIDDLTLLAPVRHPGRILCAALNYGTHAAETGRRAPSEPTLFAKFSGSLVDPHGTVVVRDADLAGIDYEGELAVVIGRRARDVDERDALSHVLGYTIANDISARAQQRADRQWWRAKGSDGFCPLGPVIVTADELGDASGLTIRTTVNGTLRQDGMTTDLIFSVPSLLAFASRFVTLEPGDVLLTGTPSGVGVAMDPPCFLEHGDQVEVAVDGIGRLRSTIELR
ncbi:fumarylacetoacetate hydrolase family protein [Frankia sp. CNm7]|uniref:Fumarylacetoacetate hydrolase family protein n=1 Tax=Frankia nepalensis TaxID=1836974 RepID=A0A937RX52_9ACTN|nr:fumarylacetoacetate hydrolase family protein [Frankia nepalensis]MBL7501978.1 fumarylacetoacetate hydrolase family protein [Frankia nepalensis]MBL7510608.1 fumarylacetoacetate hydrolase family protein [Frankia nepalensis]MBL7517348.1 fumarylacetoacetate hydrolase family protein [Frankia nepalensis]MBL7633431.1 fumarylacetoacetate hydrolase family protein [Frankia nepalensis]